MTPPESSTRLCIHRGQPGLPWTFCLLTILALLSTTDLQAQEWRLDAIDQPFVDQQRATDWRFSRLGQRLQRLD